MLARRDLVQNDDELIQLEKDLIYKFKRLRLDSPEDLFSSNNIQVIKKMDQLNLAMAEEPSQQTVYSYNASEIASIAPKKIKVFNPYDKWLKREKFKLRRIIKPRFRKRWQLIPYKPFDLQDFVFGEIIKQLKSKFN